MATQIPPGRLDLEEQIVRIRKLIVESDRLQEERLKFVMETRLAPWQIALGGVTAGAALFAAAAAFTKLFL